MAQEEVETDPEDEDEEGRDSFPTSDPPGDWAGEDVDPEAVDPSPESDTDVTPDPLPEAESAAVAAAWERSEAMEGQAPTG